MKSDLPAAWSPARRTQGTRALVIVIAILAVSALHYFTPVHHPLLHQVYQRLYYLPVVAAALWFGLRGGIGASLLSVALYIPHIFHAWSGDRSYTWNQYGETVIIILVGTLTGALSSLESRQRRKLERAMDDLAAAYARLQRAFGELQKRESMTMLGKLAAGLAHEIHNPLGSIRGAVEIIEGGGEEARREFIGIVKKELDRLQTMLRDFLDFARPRPLQFQVNNINQILQSLVRLVRPRAESAGVEIEERYGQVRDANVDSEQLKAAIMNVVLNGVEAMPNGGKLSVETTATADRLRIRVLDHGQGISEDNRARLFEPFFSTKKNGTGLGLAIAEQTVRNHGGRLQLESTGPSGSVFEIELPVTPRTSAG
ncbi:MAG: ATP-binding protein [Acidobacteriota bacterium]